MRAFAAALLCALALPAAAARADGLDLPRVQALLREQRLDGWLLYDFRGQDPISVDVAHPTGARTRRWFLLLPAQGAPVALVHKIEAHTLDGVAGEKLTYAGWRELDAGLDRLLKGRRRVAMQYSPRAALPYLSRVDAGTLELVRARRVQVVSSAELVQRVKSCWTEAGRASHLVAARHLGELKDDAWRFVAERVRAGRRVTEYEVSQRIFAGYARLGLESDGPPIVAVNAHAADPHYEPTRTESAEIRRGDLLLIDLWARRAAEGAIYADATYMAFVGPRAELPARFAQVFGVVREARDAAVAFVKARAAQGKPVRGFEVDDVARGVVQRAGYGDRFIHRTGHSIDVRVHGDGANIDDFETHDDRPLVPGVGFSIEPGIYLSGDFGVRSEIDVHMGDDGAVEVTTGAPQDEIAPLL